MSDKVVIVAMGAFTPVGECAWSSAAAVRAGVTGFEQHPFMLDTAGEPMRVALSPTLDIGLQGVERFQALIFPAIEQALAPLEQLRHQAPRTALALALPAARPGLPETLEAELAKRTTKRWSRWFTSYAGFSAGHAAGLLAMRAAATKLSAGSLDACVVAGVDSYIEPDTLEWLEQCDQLHGAGPLNNAWGFIPGEAGAALLLAREAVARQHDWEPLGTVLGLGQAHEPKRIKTETVCIGEGLTAAFSEALAALPAGAKVSDVYCDMNGEPYRADEYGFTALRTKEHFEAASDFTAPADCWGDIGAAGSLLHTVLACAAGRKQYANGRMAFAWASAEGGERAAALIETPQGA